VPSDVPIVAKWQSWMTEIGNDVLNLFESRRLFDAMTELFQRNEAGLVPGTFWAWAARNWIWSTAMGVRRQTDTSDDTISLAALIDDIARHPAELTRPWFAERWVAANPSSANAAHPIFNLHAPDGAPHIVTETVGRDLDSLRDDADRVRTVVSRRFAHSSLREVADDVTVGEVNHALNMVGERYRVYARLILQQQTVNLEPPIPEDWDRPFVLRLRR
jgi:hypothetical protein